MGGSVGGRECGRECGVRCEVRLGESYWNQTFEKQKGESLVIGQPGWRCTLLGIRACGHLTFRFFC